MMVAALYGAGSGALHAVTGPDHLLSLGPIALRRPKAPWRIGLMWGIGHGIGTLMLGLPMLFLAQYVHLPTLAAWGDRLAGVALLATALWSALTMRKPARSAADTRSPLWVGLVHGVTGAAALLLMLPVLLKGSPRELAIFLAMFAVGSALAMSALTEALALVGAQLGARTVKRTQLSLLAGSVVLGSVWLVG
jgi:nickel/cobalt transporter (NicO) family protein